MLRKEEYIKVSLEIQLFFQRIMKEHLFFVETNLQPVVPALKNEAKMLKQGFEELLAQTVCVAKGVISESAIRSNAFVTSFTLKAEEANSRLTGANINMDITRAELDLASQNNDYDGNDLYNTVCYINSNSMELLKKVIEFQDKLLSSALDCEIFITLYPLMLEHDTREAEYYMRILYALNNKTLPRKTLCEQLDFWNNIMGEHAQFIDGMLDPTERILKHTARAIAEKFELLTEDCIMSANNQIIKESIEATEGIQDYKTAATVGLLKCEIKSIIPPLLADHVLREANYYLRLFN
ncbi:MAG: DUF2935 domain-containing protein [Clostridiales bacterium]|jgi:hypothetical protein|nr:DUF2935 domain-containing protein [Clostridiales bacterium]